MVWPAPTPHQTSPKWCKMKMRLPRSYIHRLTEHSNLLAQGSKSSHVFLFVCWCLTSLLNIWVHITTVPTHTCSCGTLINVLPHRNAMPQTQDRTPHPVTVYRHRADLSLCFPLIWNVTLEYTTTHLNVLGQTRSGNPSPTFHTPQQTLIVMMLVLSQKLSRKCTIPTRSWTRANPLHYLLAYSCFLMFTWMNTPGTFFM